MASAQQKEIWKQQLDRCIKFFNEVAEELKDTHVIVPSKSKKWQSMCLVRKGEEKQVNYYGKPVNSLRVAPNWNWRAGIDRCSNANYIQCVTPDLPFAKKRSPEHPEWSTMPIFGNMVGYFDTDNKYHCVFGEKYDFDFKSWMWVENIPSLVAKKIRERMVELDKVMDQPEERKLAESPENT